MAIMDFFAPAAASDVAQMKYQTQVQQNNLMNQYLAQALMQQRAQEAAAEQDRLQQLAMMERQRASDAAMIERQKLVNSSEIERAKAVANAQADAQMRYLTEQARLKRSEQERQDAVDRAEAADQAKGLRPEYKRLNDITNKLADMATADELERNKAAKRQALLTIPPKDAQLSEIERLVNTGESPWQFIRQFGGADGPRRYSDQYDAILKATPSSQNYLAQRDNMLKEQRILADGIRSATSRNPKILEFLSASDPADSPANAAAFGAIPGGESYSAPNFDLPPVGGSGGAKSAAPSSSGSLGNEARKSTGAQPAASSVEPGLIPRLMNNAGQALSDMGTLAAPVTRYALPNAKAKLVGGKLVNFDDVYTPEEKASLSDIGNSYQYGSAKTLSELTQLMRNPYDLVINAEHPLMPNPFKSARNWISSKLGAAPNRTQVANDVVFNPYRAGLDSSPLAEAAARRPGSAMAGSLATGSALSGLARFSPVNAPPRIRITAGEPVVYPVPRAAIGELPPTVSAPGPSLPGFLEAPVGVSYQLPASIPPTVPVYGTAANMNGLSRAGMASVPAGRMPDMFTSGLRYAVTSDRYVPPISGLPNGLIDPATGARIRLAPVPQYAPQQAGIPVNMLP